MKQGGAQREGWEQVENIKREKRSVWELMKCGMEHA